VPTTGTTGTAGTNETFVATGICYIYSCLQS
jgi:hypothetical protein